MRRFTLRQTGMHPVQGERQKPRGGSCLFLEQGLVEADVKMEQIVDQSFRDVALQQLVPIARRHPLATLTHPGAGQLIARHVCDAQADRNTARQAHNLKVIGSNPIPATKISPVDQVVTPGVPGFSLCDRPFSIRAENCS